MTGRAAATQGGLAAIGLLAAAVIPVGIELTRKIPGAALLDAVWAFAESLGVMRPTS
jgi:hypothetical protein